MATVTPPSISALPTPPDPNDRSTFNTRAYPWSAALPTFGTEVSAVAANVKANADEAAVSAVTATEGAVIAAGAVATSGAVRWVSGSTYAIGNLVYSPLDLANYRRKTAGAGTVDPSLDQTNWASVSGIGITLLATVTLGAVSTVGITNLPASKRLTIVGTGVTLASATYVAVKLSVDNGVAFPGSAVVISLSNATPYPNFAQIHNAGFADQKVTSTWAPANAGVTVETNATVNAGVVNAIRIYTVSGANFTGGTFKIYGEN